MAESSNCIFIKLIHCNGYSNLSIDPLHQTILENGGELELHLDVIEKIFGLLQIHM